MMSILERAYAVLRQKPRITLEAYTEKSMSRGLTADGSEEIPSDEIIAPPLGYKKQPSMVEHIRNMVRSEQLRVAAEKAGAETFEEADDFEVDDDPAPIGSAEMFEREFEPPIVPDPAKPLPAAPAPAPRPALATGESEPKAVSSTST